MGGVDEIRFSAWSIRFSPDRRLEPSRAAVMSRARDKDHFVLMPGQASGLELEYPARLVEPSAWLGHVPFALWLVAAIRPRIIVELGVHTGNSYCAFLQA